MSLNKPRLVELVLCCSLAVFDISARAQTPGTLEYFAEMEINKSALFTIEELQLMKAALPPEYHERIEYYLNLRRAGHEYEYEASLWADIGDNRATNVFLTFPNGQIRVGILNDGDFEFAGWPSRVYTFAELKAALPPGTYHLTAYFEQGSGTNYTAVLPEYTEASFPQFIPGRFTWAGSSNAPLVLEWETVAGVDEYELSAQQFPAGESLLATGNIFPTHPSKLTNELTGATVGAGFYSAYIQAERDVDVAAFNFEFSTYSSYHFIPGTLRNPKRTSAGFECDLVGGNGTSYVLQGSTNLVEWISLGAATVVNNEPLHFIDPSATGFPRRFYRARWTPPP